MKYLISIVFMLSSAIVFGQENPDLIVSSAGDSLKCKIIEVKPDEIQFRFGTGGIISIPRNDVASYQYNFTTVLPEPKTETPPSEIQKPVVETVVKSETTGKKYVKAAVGIKAGLNMSNISNKMTDISFVSEIKPDFHAGILLNMRFGYINKNSPGRVGLQPELLYSRQGFNVDGNTVRFDYINANLLLKMYFTKSLNFEIGPWAGTLMTVNPSYVDVSGNRINVSNLQDGKDAGIAFGLGMDINPGFLLGVRYYQGLSNMANNLKWKNYVIGISLGWIF